MHLGILGPGRLGRSLAALLQERAVRVSLCGRGERPPQDCDATLLTVPDTAIPSLVSGWSHPAPVLHCSGALGVHVLRPLAPAGSFHPLMTFPGPEVGLPDLTDVPAVVDGDPEAVGIGEFLAETLGMRAMCIPGDRRLYHASAVMAGNFATVLLAHAAEVLEAAGVPREQAGPALLPLALQSLRNAAKDPAAALTGPIARGDEAIVGQHRAALREFGLKEAAELYDELSCHARELYRREH